MKKTKAFTLIELLIVIAIIGILAGGILVSVNTARRNAKTSSIISSAVSLMKAAQTDSVASGDYSKWGGWPSAGWTITSANPTACNTRYTTVSDPASAQAACRSIITNQGAASPGTYGNIFSATFSAAGNNFIYPKLSIMVWIPGENLYFCIGSNGRSSKTTNAVGSGCGASWSWSCPGCPMDGVGESG